MGAEDGRMPRAWRRFESSRVAIGLATLIALLSVVTGILNITQETVQFGPLAGQVPEVIQAAAGFTGALTGFLMLLSAFALSRGLRIGWWSTLLLMPVTIGQGLLQASPYSFPLVVLSVIAIPVLIVTRSMFDRDLSLTSTQLAAGGALVGVQMYGTVGGYALREQFTGMESPLEAFYFTLITSSTVGYGDITPETEMARLFTMSLVVLGVASFGIAIGALIGPAIQARLSRTLGKMTESQLELLDDHILVLGYGELTEPVLDILDDQGLRYGVITADRDVAATLSDRDIQVLTGDPSEAEPLRRMKVQRSRAIVVATNSDADDSLTILNAREVHPEGRIVAAATDRENVVKLRKAGADDVLSPAEIGGHLLLRSALGESNDEILDQLFGD